MERHRGDADTKHGYSMSAIIRGEGGIVTNAARILQRKSNTLFSICQTLMREKEQSVCFPGINLYRGRVYTRKLYTVDNSTDMVINDSA